MQGADCSTENPTQHKWRGEFPRPGRGDGEGAEGASGTNPFAAFGTEHVMPEIVPETRRCFDWMSDSSPLKVVFYAGLENSFDSGPRLQAQKPLIPKGWRLFRARVVPKNVEKRRTLHRWRLRPGRSQASRVPQRAARSPPDTASLFTDYLVDGRQRRSERSRVPLRAEDGLQLRS